MELTIQVNPHERTVRFREVSSLAAGDVCSVTLDGVRGADLPTLRLAMYRDAASASPVASCPSFSAVPGHPNLASGTLGLDTAEMAAWFDAVLPDGESSDDGGPEERTAGAAERAVRADGWLVVSDSARTWAACRVPVILRPGAGTSGVVDPTSLAALVGGLVSAAMSGALSGKADKASPAVEGHLASLDAAGNLVDSLKSPSDFTPATHASDGSIHHTASEIGRIAAGEVAKVVANAPADLDTLKEIADVIGTESGQTAGGILKRVANLESGKANRSEMSITPVAGSPDRKTIQLRSGMRAAVLTDHQDISGKVDKVPGKGLSENDYTDADKAKLARLSPQTQADWNQTNAAKPDFIKNKPTLAAVATSGSYDDLTGKPMIPEPVTVDSVLSSTSENPVQNKAVTMRLDKLKLSVGNMLAPSGELLSLFAFVEVVSQGSSVASPVEFYTSAGTDRLLARKVSMSDLPYALVEPGKWEITPAEVEGDALSIALVDYGDGDLRWVLYRGSTSVANFSDEDADDMAIDFGDIPGIGNVTATRASLPGHLLDRAVNAVPVSSATGITLPEKIAGGKSRDFYVRLTVSSESAVTFAATDSGGDAVAWDSMGNPSGTFAVGTHLYRFTEVADGVFHAADITDGGSIDPAVLDEKLDASSAAPAFSDSRTYLVGEYVTYGGVLYRCKTAVNTAGAWTGTSNWEADDMTSPDATLDIMSDGRLRVVTVAGEDLWMQGYDLESTSAQVLKCEMVNLLRFPATTAEAFDSTVAYAVGDSVVYGGMVYKFTSAHSAGDWIGTDASVDSVPLTMPYVPVGKVGDFVLDVDNSANASVKMVAELSGLFTAFDVFVDKGRNLSDLLTFDGGEQCELYFTMTAFGTQTKPAWKVVKQVMEKQEAGS